MTEVANQTIKNGNITPYFEFHPGHVHQRTLQTNGQYKRSSALTILSDSKNAAWMQQILIDHMCHPNEQFGMFLPNSRDHGITSEQRLQIIGSQNQYLDTVKQIRVKNCKLCLLNTFLVDDQENLTFGPLLDTLLSHKSKQPNVD